MSTFVDPMLLPIVLPFLAGLVCLLMPRRAGRSRSVVAVVSTALTLALVWRLFSRGEVLDLQAIPWLHLRVDGLSALLALAIATFGLLVSVYSVGYMKGRERHGEYFAYLLWTVAASLGAVLANDFLALLACWGLLGPLLYLMIGIAGSDAAEAARKSFLIVAGADAVLVLGVVLVWSVTGTTRMDAATLPLAGAVPHIAFIAFVVAAFAKAGAVPLHTWVPDCGEKADPPVTALLPASLDKLLGIYLLLRAALDLFEITAAMQALLTYLGVFTIVAAAMMALVQRDMKRLLAYSTVSQVGYMVLGIGTGTAVGIAGGLFHLLNHAVYKCCLFLCAGAVQKQTGTTDLDRLGGLSRSMPVTFTACAIAALSISGVPPLNGFASKWMVYQGIIGMAERGGFDWILILIAAMLGSALTLAGVVKVLHAAFLSKPAPEIAQRAVRESDPSMLLPMLVLAGACVLFGVFAQPLALERLVFPAVPARPEGVWWAGLATVLILSAIAAGAILYVVTMAGGRVRRVETYVGGERLDEVYIRDTDAGPARHVEVTGVDFYRTLEQLPGIGWLYALSRKKAFDVYDLGGIVTSYVVTLLRSAHTGALAVYLTWFLVGVLAMLFAIAYTGP